MNERIRELWLQAAREDSGDTWDSQTEFIERFAELIVRECIDTVSDCSVEYCTRPQIVGEIKQHFGLAMSVVDKKQLIKDLLGVSE